MTKIIYILVFSFLVFSCEKDKNVDKVTITVRDLESWTPQYTECRTVSGAEVSIYEHSADPHLPPSYSSTTNSSGEVTIGLETNGSYYLVVDLVSRSNVISRETREGFTVAYIIMDVFQSQAAVDEYPPIPDKCLSAGDPKVLDYNGDGLIASDDKLTGYYFIAEDELSLTVYIAEKTSFD